MPAGLRACRSGRAADGTDKPTSVETPESAEQERPAFRRFHLAELALALAAWRLNARAESQLQGRVVSVRVNAAAASSRSSTD